MQFFTLINYLANMCQTNYSNTFFCIIDEMQNKILT